MTVKVNLTGSAQLADDLVLGDSVFLLVKAHVKKAGTAETATQGEQEFRTLSMLEVIVAPGTIRETVAATIAAHVAERDGTTEPLKFPPADPAPAKAAAKKATTAAKAPAKKVSTAKGPLKSVPAPVSDVEWENG